MRVLLVTNMYPPHHLGGYELSCRDVVERFRRRGHDVTILTTTFRKEGAAPDGSEESCVRRELDFYWRSNRPWLPGGRDVLRLERHDRRVLRAAIRETDPDVISLWNMGALPLSLVGELARHDVPVVHHTCNDWPRLNLVVDGFRDLLRRRPVVARVGARLAGIPTRLPDVGSSGTFCWVSQATWDAAEASTPWRFRRSIVVHSGISHEDFPVVDPPSQPRAWGGRLLFVGRIDGLKGVETAIDALTELPETTLDLVGPGDEGYVTKLIERTTPGRTRWEEVPRSALRARYMAADALLFTSLDEPFGLVPIEAMACGTPVVATGTGGSAEFLVDGRNCLLYPPGDARALADAVRRLADDPKLRSSLVIGGLTTAREFTVDRLTDRLESAHLGAVSDHAAQAGG